MEQTRPQMDGLLPGISRVLQLPRTFHGAVDTPSESDIGELGQRSTDSVQQEKEEGYVQTECFDRRFESPTYLQSNNVWQIKRMVSPMNE